MICQLASVLGALGSQLLETGLDVGRQFLSRELGRVERRREKDLIKLRAQASGQGGNFVQAQQTGAFSSGFVQGAPIVPAGVMVPGLRDLVEMTPTLTRTDLPLNGAGPLPAPRGQVGAGMRGVGRRRWVRKRDGTGVQHFRWNGSTMVEIEMAPQLTGRRFRQDLETGRFFPLPSRRRNPFNFRAAERAGKRIDMTLDAVKGLVSIQKKKEKGVSCAGQVVSFRTKKKKKKCG